MISDIIFIDANIPIHAGRLSKSPADEKVVQSCQAVLEATAKREIMGVADICVLEEVVFRGWKEKLFTEGLGVFKKFSAIVNNVLSIDEEDLSIFENLCEKYGRQTAEPMDYLHAAVMINHNIKIICSCDDDFDLIKEVKRIDPIDLAKQLKKRIK